MVKDFRIKRTTKHTIFTTARGDPILLCAYSWPWKLKSLKLNIPVIFFVGFKVNIKTWGRLEKRQRLTVLLNKPFIQQTQRISIGNSIFECIRLPFR